MSNLKLVPYTNSRNLLAVKAEVPSSEIDLSQLTLSSTDVKQGIKYLKSDGTFGTGTLPIQTGTITLTGTSATLPEGYYNGNTVTLGNTDLANLVAANIKAGVPILGVTGSYTGDLNVITSYHSTPQSSSDSIEQSITFGGGSDETPINLNGAAPKRIIIYISSTSTTYGDISTYLSSSSGRDMITFMDISIDNNTKTGSFCHGHNSVIYCRQISSIADNLNITTSGNSLTIALPNSIQVGDSTLRLRFCKNRQYKILVFT